MATRSVVVRCQSHLFLPGVEVDGHLFVFEPTHFYKANLQACAFALLAEAFADPVDALTEAGLTPTELAPGEDLVDAEKRGRCEPPRVGQINYQI